MIIRALAAVLFLFGLIGSASAQGLGNLPPNTVVGRLGAGTSGPAQAIPFATLGPQLSLTSTIAVGTTPVTGGTNGDCLTINAGLVGQVACLSGLITVPGGGTGVTSFTANLPLLGNGTGNIIQGTVSGNTNKFAEVSGALTSGHCIAADGSGNLVDEGGACVSSSSGVSAGSINQAAYYAATGSVVSGISAGAIPYLVTNGTTARKSQDRWVDNWTEAPDIGVDCTNTSDSTTAIQTWVNANLSGGHLHFPTNCQFFTTATITIADAVNIVFDSSGIAGSGGSHPAQWNWKGTNGGTSCGGQPSNASASFANCQYVLDFEHSDHPTVQGISFNSPAATTGWIGDFCPDGFLKFDGNPVSHIGTGGHVINNAFGNGGCNNPNFVAVDISRTAVDNHENYIVRDNVTFCSDTTGPGPLATNVVTNSTTTITSASNPFTAGMVGKRIILSFANTTNPGDHSGTVGPISRGYFDTTVASFTSSSSVVLAAAVPFTANPVAAYTGSGLGIAYRNGASQNAIQQTFANLQYFGCNVGVYIAGGGVQVTQLSSGFSNLGLFAGGFRAQNTTLDYYASENDFIAVIDTGGAAAPFEFSNGRLSNGNGLASGFLQLGGIEKLKNNLVDFGLQNTNSQLIGPYMSIGVSALGSVTGGSGYVNGTYTNVPLTAVSPTSGTPTPHATVVVSGGAVTSVTITNIGGGGVAGAIDPPGDLLTTSNTNLGGTGSGFSVPITAYQNNLNSANNDNFGSIFSTNNDWQNGCCGTVIDGGNIGFGQWQNQPIEQFGDLTANNNNLFAAHQLQCSQTPTGACLFVQSQVQNSQNGVGIAVNMANWIVAPANTTSFLSTSGGGLGTTFGAGSVSHTGYEVFAPANTPTTLTGYDAGWNSTNFVTAATTVYGFHAEIPAAGSGGTTIYGFECDKQKAGFTNSFCFYNANIADFNFFAGPVITAPTIVANLPACAAGTQGATMFVTDQATAVAYHGAVTGSGSNKQRVTCDGTAWYQD